ncbi:hypothetical protein NT04LM_0391 [Listeria monocytogenes FSL F2-208]|nr:hypothetical protein NT04LM_0391 [Listeria monocytogenes FSL F2-208]
MAIISIVEFKPRKTFWGFSFSDELLLKTNQPCDVLRSINFCGRMNSIVTT